MWPEPQRAFLHDGPGLLLTESQRQELLSLDEEGRQRFIEEFLGRDPIPETPGNELQEGIERRQRLVAQEFDSPSDVRARLLFLNGRPDAKVLVECGVTFVPAEIWVYGDLPGETRDGEPTLPLEEPPGTGATLPAEGPGEPDDAPKGTPQEAPEGAGPADAAGEPTEEAGDEREDERETEERDEGAELNKEQVRSLTGRSVVVYEPSPGKPWRLWLPLDSKRVLYTSEMEYWLEQWEELQGRILGAKRFDLQICDTAPAVDYATGVRGLRDFMADRPTRADYQAYLQPPEDLAAWAAEAARTPVSPAPPPLEVRDLEIQFPEKRGQRMLTRALLTIPSGAFGIDREGDEPEVRFVVEGVVEQDGAVFDDFRLRFDLEPPAEDVPLALAVDRQLRPGQQFLLRLEVRDEVAGTQADLVRSFTVPREAREVPVPPVPEKAMVALGQELAERPIPGADSLILVPPETDVVLGLWRAEALVTGDGIQKVVFKVDGTPQLTRTSPPWTAEVRLAEFPVEQVVSAEGYGGDGELLASDRVLVNQPRGALRVRIVEPERGTDVEGRVPARAEVVVPEGRRVERVEFKIDEELVKTLEQPPWQTTLEVAPTDDVSFLSVTAFLDDGSRAEDVRFLNSPEYLDEVDVNLVELYTAVTDRDGRLVSDLTEDDFEVYEDGRRQELVKFELVRNLPLTVGITIDTSGSMVTALPEAKRAAATFLDSVLQKGDRSFAVAFANQARLLMPPTEDEEAVAEMLEGLQAVGWTSLHDAVVTSLYYFRGVRGQRALVLLSDGDDTSSSIGFREALEYARRSGVAIYSIGLDVGRLNVTVRNKLKSLAEETGGRFFFISKARELEGVYDQIEEELRSRYLLAYNSDQKGSEEGDFRQVEVKVDGRGLEARTIRGYYP